MDTGAGAILSALRSRGAGDLNLKSIIVTHAHRGHAYGIGSFPESEGYASEAAATAIRRMELP